MITVIRAILCSGVSLLLLLNAADADYGIQINEIMYHPAHGVDEPEDVRQEYIELYNNSDTAVNLGGWRVSRGIAYDFQPGTVLHPRQYLVVAADVAQFTSLYPDVTAVTGGWTGRLSNRGELITLVDASGNTVDEVAYCDEGDWSYRKLGDWDQGHRGWEWSKEHDGEGKSLEVIDQNLPNAYGQNWQASSYNGGTPGRPNFVSSPDIAPFILDVSHEPIIPTSHEPVSISAWVKSYRKGPVHVAVFFRVDGSASFASKVMVDDGMQGDERAGDHVFTASLPPQPHGTIVEFYVKAIYEAQHVRTWPAPTRPDPLQRANALYQVDDSIDIYGPWIPGSLPVYHLIMPAAEWQELERIWLTSDSDAQMNGTFISRDGTGIQCRYCVGIRNRGNIRGVTPISFRVNLTHDNPWRDITALNINSKYPHSQLMGSVLFKRAGLTAADATAIQVRVNGHNLAVLDELMYGSYVAVEVLDSSFVENHFPNDSNGNLYRVKDASNTGVPGLTYEGDQSRHYRDTYFKQTNSASDDWQDLIRLTYILNNTADDDLVNKAREVVDLDQWVRFLAVDTLAGNLEGGLTSGRGDDVALYRGMVDERFVLIPHDLDTILGQGDLSPDLSRSVFTYAQVAGLKNLLNHPDVVLLYYQQLTELIATVFNPANFDSLAQQFLGSWIPQTIIDQMRQYVRSRNNSVLSQIEQTMEIYCDLPRHHGYYYTHLPQLTLQGTANAIRTQSVLVHGILAQWNPKGGMWALGLGASPGIGLHPGINRIKVQAFDEYGGSGHALQVGHVDVWCDLHFENKVAGMIDIDTTWDATSGPWHLVGDVDVPKGITLTILPGTTVFIDPDTSLRVHGRLLVVGSPHAIVRFTRTPGHNEHWSGIKLFNSQEDNQICHSVIEYGRTPTGMVDVENSVVLIDHVAFAHTDLTRLRMANSSVIIQNSIFTDMFSTGEMPSTDNQSEQILGVGIPVNGHLIIQNNVFGTTKGHNDVIDFTGPVRPGPVIQILNNVFKGGGDELLDLGGDAYIEGNLFMHVQKDRYNVSSGYANAISTGDDNVSGIIDVVRNIFYDVDHAVSLKNDTFMFFEHNLVMGIPNDSLDPETPYSAINLLIPDRDLPGRGAFLTGNIFADIPQRIFDHVDESSDASTNFTSDLNMHYTLIEPDRAGDRVGRQYRPILSLGVGNMAEDPRVLVSNAGTDFMLAPGSYAHGNGLYGMDIGPFISSGAIVSNAPLAHTWQSTATLYVSGPGVTHYRYWINNSPISEEISIDSPIQLSELPDGTYTAYVVGKNAAGVWQDAETPSVSKTWTVDHSWEQIHINEVLIINESADEYAGTFPGLIELHNVGPSEIKLAGMSMTNDLIQPLKFTFSDDLSLQPSGYMVLFADDEQTAEGLHLGFSLDGDGDSLYLIDPCGNVLDSVRFGPQVPNLSIGRTGHHSEWTLTRPTFGMPNRATGLGDQKTLTVNEWLACSETVFPEDFIELYNPDPLPVALGGLYLTDNPISEPNKHEIAPLSFISGNGYAVFLADGATENGPRHICFRLSANQEMIGLFTEEQKPIDMLLYGPQTLDVSQGRTLDGTDELVFSALPTPGAANADQTSQSRRVNVISFDDLWFYDDSAFDWSREWREPSFWGTQIWPSGQALLGSGFAGQSLPEPVNTEIAVNVTTVYFLRDFNLDVDLESVAALELSAIVDDGAVFYLNGTEVLRLGIDGVRGDDEADCSQPASRTVSRPSHEGPFYISMESLSQGKNTVAVEVHQSAEDNTEDILFGMELDVISTHIMQQDSQLNNRLALLQGLRITEIMYNPIKGSDYEFVELQNVGAQPLDLTGVRFTRGINFGFPETILDPGEYVVVVKDIDCFRSSYGEEVRIAGEYDGKLDNDGESILLQLPEPLEAAILRFAYDDDWYPATDGRGYSLVIQKLHVPAYTWSFFENWGQSADLSGSPGY